MYIDVNLKTTFLNFSKSQNMQNYTKKFKLSQKITIFIFRLQHWKDGADFINNLEELLGLPENTLTDRTYV